MKLGSFRIMSASFHTPLKLFSHQKRHKSLSQLTHVMFYIYPLQKTLFLYSSACFLTKLGSFRIFSALFASFRIFSSVTALFALYTHPSFTNRKNSASNWIRTRNRYQLLTTGASRSKTIESLSYIVLHP